MSRTEYDGRRYPCRSGPDAGGCGKISVTAPAVEQLISEAVLLRLDSRELVDALEGRHQADATAAMLSEEIARDTTKL